MIQFDFNNVYAGETKKLWSLLIQIPVLLKKIQNKNLILYM